MTVQEIRIGNFLNLIDTRGEIYLPFGPVKVYRFNHESICFCDISDEFHKVNRFTEAMVFEFEPIPITEKWLLRFGFKKIDKYTWKRGSWFIYNRKRGFVTGSKNREVKLDHVHVLQNWWYFNNNLKELEIKEL